MKILLENALILTDPFSELMNSKVLIEDGKITKIGDFTDQQVDERHDFTGKLIMPGLVNSHTHAAMSLMRGIAEDMNLQDWLFKKIFPIEERLTDKDVYYGTMLSQMEMARKGIVAYIDMYFHCDAVAQAAIDFGMKAVVTRGLTDSGSSSDNGRLRQNIEYFERWNGRDGLISVGFGPHAPYSCSLKYIDQIAQVAHSLGAKVTIHLYESKSEDYPLSELLRTSLSKCDVIFAHCVHIKEQEIDLLARPNFFVAHNPTSNLKLANGIAPIQKMINRKVQVCLGTDGAASNNTLDIFYEMRLATLLQKSTDPTNISVEQALSMATLMGAKASGLTTGRIEIGADADLVVLDIQKPWYLPIEKLKAHLVHSANSADVFATMIKGKWVYYNGSYPTINESEIRRVSKEVMEKLIDIES